MDKPTLESGTTTFTPIYQTELLSRVRGEFREMPGLRLSLEQAMRLWSLDRATCVELLNQLRSNKFLDLDSRGQYRLTNGGY